MAPPAPGVLGFNAARHTEADGRLITADIDWAGHRLIVASAYLPNDAADRRRFIQERLSAEQTAAVVAGAHLLIGGDFNFVEDAALDRRPLRRQADETATCWRQHMAGVVDVWRHAHPQQRMYTHFWPTSAARLDRFYASPGLLDYTKPATAAVRGAHLSDHRLVVVDIAPRRPTDRPRRPPARVRLSFLSDPDLTNSFRERAEALAAAAPAQDAAFIVWWPRFKASLGAVCRRLNRQQHDALRARGDGIDRDVERLMASVEAGNDAAIPAVIAAQQLRSQEAQAQAAQRQLSDMRQWLHDGERPSPGITMRLKRPAEARDIAAIRDATGRLATTAPHCAEALATFSASISAQPAVDAAAQREVLAALAGSPRITAEHAAMLDSTIFTAADVQAPQLSKETLIAFAARGVAVFTVAADAGDAAAWAAVLSWAHERLPAVQHFAHAAGVTGFDMLKVAIISAALKLDRPPLQCKQEQVFHSDFLISASMASFVRCCCSWCCCCRCHCLVARCIRSRGPMQGHITSITCAAVPHDYLFRHLIPHPEHGSEAFAVAAVSA